jgi:hypothetical protein
LGACIENYDLAFAFDAACSLASHGKECHIACLELGWPELNRCYLCVKVRVPLATFRLSMDHGDVLTVAHDEQPSVE